MGEELKPVVRGGLFKGPVWAVHVDRHQGRIADLRCARKLNWQLEESGRSRLRLSFFDVQTQLTAAVSPICSLVRVQRMSC
jgi:hypothetical protein